MLRILGIAVAGSLLLACGSAGRDPSARESVWPDLQEQRSKAQERWRFQDGITATAADVVEPPSIPPGSRFHYPQGAREQRINGTVKLELRVDSEGRVADAIVLQGVDPSLDQAAVTTVKSWKLKPAKLNGVAQASVFLLEVNYQVQ